MRFARAPRQADPFSLTLMEGQSPPPPQIPYSVERWRGGRLEGGRTQGKKKFRERDNMQSVTETPSLRIQAKSLELTDFRKR